jgi:AmmeMemoRadiSam system protein B
MMRIKPAAVAGLFYPDDPTALHQTLASCLAAADPTPGERPRALIAPHAGYVYSGPIAASAYATLRPWRDQIRRVMVLAPSHRVAFRGIATSSAGRFATPLGEIPVDQATVARLGNLAGVIRLDAAFEQEHALEVQLPFLQTVLDEFELIPLIVGQAEPGEVDRVIEVANTDDALVVVSSDLSHYHDYATSQARDAQTSAHIVQLSGEDIGPHDACGAAPIRGLLQTARQHGWQAQTLDLRNSGDTAGTRDRVVGYGAYAFY